MKRNTLYVGDCLATMKQWPDACIDSVVTDPPYGLSFMGKAWDYDVPTVDVWRECLRLLKPGGHLLAFAGTRTQHRMAVNIEDAGFEIRDMIAWVYGSGFPKSLDVSKAIDKAAGAEREVVGKSPHSCRRSAGSFQADDGAPHGMVGNSDGARIVTAPATPDAEQWQGWGTALKPALEPITVARKPLIGTVAENVLKHGTGAINVDGARVAGKVPQVTQGATDRIFGKGKGLRSEPTQSTPSDAGRWPANLIHDGSDEVVELFPEQSSGRLTADQQINGGYKGAKNCYGDAQGGGSQEFQQNSGSAARFDYCAKASGADRGPNNNHPTVKPTDLMRYLVKLVTPERGVVLDPYLGSGTTAVAAKLVSCDYVGCELNPEYIELAESRLSQGVLF